MSDDTTDYSPHPVFHAVGMAITVWETLESHMSYLYGVFIGKPLKPEVLEAYGRENKIFEKRMQGLSEAAEGFFRSRSSQEKEAEIDAIIAEARRLSIYRHQIALGVMSAVAVTEILRTPEDIEKFAEHGYRLRRAHWIVPPWHGVFHLTKHQGGDFYHYGSAQINAYTKEFDALTRRVIDFGRSLGPEFWNPFL